MIRPRSDMYVPLPATLLTVEPMTELETLFRFEMDQGELLDYMPGQFLMLTVPGVGQAPISITSCPEGGGDSTFDMVIRRVGSVTDAVHRLLPGAKVGVRGPYGTRFPVDGAMRGNDVLFVCGGIGLVPVHSAIAYVLKNRNDYGKVTVLYGARSPEERVFTATVAEWVDREDIEVLETVDVAKRGWNGNVGVITHLFPLVNVDPERTTAIVCGPPVMYKFVLLELYKLHIMPNQVFLSLERKMKCGVGKCGHCQINNLYACQDGPVVRYSDIQHLQEAL